MYSWMMLATFALLVLGISAKWGLLNAVALVGGHEDGVLTALKLAMLLCVLAIVACAWPAVPLIWLAVWLELRRKRKEAETERLSEFRKEHGL